MSLVEGIGIDDFEQVKGIFQPVHGLQFVQAAYTGGNQRTDGLGQVQVALLSASSSPPDAEVRPKACCKKSVCNANTSFRKRHKVVKSSTSL